MAAVCLTKSSRLAGWQASDPASEERHRAEADDYGQLALLWCGAAPNLAECRLSIAQGASTTTARIHRRYMHRLQAPREMESCYPTHGLARTQRRYRKWECYIRLDTTGFGTVLENGRNIFDRGHFIMIVFCHALLCLVTYSVFRTALL